MTATMTKLDLLSDLFVELSIEDQQFISGGKNGDDDDGKCYKKCMKKSKKKCCKDKCDDD